MDLIRQADPLTCKKNAEWTKKMNPQARSDPWPVQAARWPVNPNLVT